MSLTRNSRIGVALAAISVVLLAWSLAGKPNPLERHDTVWVELRDVSTVIHFDRDVRLGGVNVGTIGAIERRGDIARVELLLKPGTARALRADASVELRPHTLFDGNSFVELHSGSRSAAALGDRTIPLARSRNYVSLDKAVRVLDDDSRQALPALLRDVRKTLTPAPTRALRRSFEAAPPVLRDTRRWARAAQGPTRRELAGAVAGFSRTATAIARQREDLGPLLRGTAATTTALHGADRALERTLAVLPPALARVDHGSDAVLRVLQRATPLARDLTPAMLELRPTLAELRPVLAQAVPVLRRTQPFAADLRATLVSAGRAAGPTAALLRRLQPILTLAAEQVVPFLRSKTPTGVTTAQALLATAASGAATLSPVKTLEQASAPANSGPGHAYYISTSGGNDHVGCGTIPDPAIAEQLKGLELCTP